MLVLSRKIGERLVIGDNITIVVNKIVGNRVTLGIEAPDNVRVMRSELRTYDDSEEIACESIESQRNAKMSTPITLEFDTGALAAFVSRVAK